MSDTVITVENLSKRYVIGHEQEGSYKTLRDLLTKTARRAGRRLLHPLNGSAAASNGRKEEFWALKDVSFDIKRGEVVGIIGRNGAGKSTLLKILSRITEPTTGRVRIRGRVASLLEVGTGFHPELTGRENIFLNGAILGMSKAEIKRKFDEIVAFAEVEKFLDTPVKRYSSGMYVRLAFAVAAHLEPEILIIDEVLAVGDAQFQKKCLGKMDNVAKEGRTVLFVSHNMAAVQSLCYRVLWFQSGKLADDGQASRIVANYLSSSLESASERMWPDIAEAPGTDNVRLHRVCVHLKEGRPVDEITIKTPFVMEFEYWNLEPDSCLNLSLHIYNEHGVIVFNAVPIHDREWFGRPFPPGLFRSTCQIPGGLMNDGMYRVELLVVKNQTTVIYKYDDVLTFDIRDEGEEHVAWHGGWAGAVRPVLDWHTELVSSDVPFIS
jgi:lipopolysaccharide transport system ATP-binding protein